MGNAPRHFDIFNDVLESNKAGADHSFPIFSSLAPELRLKIWQESLCQGRLLTVTLALQREDRVTPTAPPYTTQNKLGNRISGSLYELKLFDHHEDSPLLWTTHESRQAAQQFYRVQIPLRYGISDRVLYFNPEYDILCVQRDDRDVPGGYFVDFLNDVRAYDPKSVGVLQLAMVDRQDIVEGLSDIDPVHLPSVAVSAFKQTLLTLDHFIAVMPLDRETRTVPGPFAVAGRRRFYFNHSVPVFATAERFQLFDADPRPIEADLTEVTSFGDPKELRFAWEQLERSFGCRGGNIVRSSGYQFSYALAVRDRYHTQVYHRQSMKKLLVDELTSWARFFEELLKFVPYHEEEYVAKDVTDAAGFWLLPSDAFDKLFAILAASLAILPAGSSETPSPAVNASRAISNPVHGDVATLDKQGKLEWQDLGDGWKMTTISSDQAKRGGLIAKRTYTSPKDWFNDHWKNWGVDVNVGGYNSRQICMEGGAVFVGEVIRANAGNACRLLVNKVPGATLADNGWIVLNKWGLKDEKGNSGYVQFLLGVINLDVKPTQAFCDLALDQLMNLNCMKDDDSQGALMAIANSFMVGFNPQGQNEGTI
ncbi:hypothetical protein F4779DRAFT_619246 [Xylariaceae sp. FL0662B]|nr:hypothetical protein F4779DRAFT_619246 [Xylariaceae sp. FL0662B]